MRRLGKFLALTPVDQRLLLAATGWAAAARLALWMLPFRTVRPLFTLTRRRTPARQLPLQRLLASIQLASKLIPGSTCLTKALAAQALLARHGYDATLRIGVRRGESGEFQAHAWLERDGITLGDQDQLETYSPLPPL